MYRSNVLVILLINVFSLGYVKCDTFSDIYESGSVTIAMRDYVCVADDVIDDASVGSNVHCAAICKSNQACEGFFYHDMDKTCVTCDTWYADVTNLVTYSGMVYSRHFQVPGLWNIWTSWSACSLSCGGGRRTRTRTCDMEAFGSYTGPCEGSSIDEIHCHDFSCVPLAATCDEWASRGLTESGDVAIDPDSTGTTFGSKVVLCDLDSEPGKAITVLHHNQESRTFVNGYEGCGSYSVALTYIIGFEEAKQVADKSTACTQYVNWECLSSDLSWAGHQTACTAWKNRNVVKSVYFTGPYPTGIYCECGHMGNCHGPLNECNCDSNDGVWRNDDGNITNKADLPISYFTAGDTGLSYEQGYHTIGPMLCW